MRITAKHKITLLLFCIMVLLILSLSCGKSNPVTSEEITPGRRDYTWTVDTLDMPVNQIHSIWGSSPSDIWACGPAGDESKWFQHYDGKKWTPYNISYSGNTLFGFSRNDVWMGSGDGQIWHYDGVSWKRNYTYKADNGRNLVEVMNIWGSSPNDVYASGVMFYKGTVYEPESNRGFILHYDGQEWTEVLKGEFNSQFATIRKFNNEVFVQSYSFDLKRSYDDQIVFYKLSGNKLEKIYSGLHGVINFADFDLVGDNLYFWIGRDICSYSERMGLSKENFLKIFTVNEPMFNYYVFGRSMKDLFISTLGGLAHYNGEDVQYILHYPDTQRIVAGTLFFEKEIVCAFVDYSTNTNMVVHGKLK
ncbi:MAG TPA: hypothetical protein VHO03_19270 [Ignavibacteriales bacterium]|nr:hypothetical protein [Ignavibacteriales bacterium]